MNSDKKLNVIDNLNCWYYYFDDKININVLNLDNILINEKSYENILTDNVA